MESTSALDGSQRKVQPGQQQTARSSSESKDLASEFSKLFQAMFGGAPAALNQASDPLSVFSEIEVAPPVVKAEEAPTETTQKTESDNDSKETKDAEDDSADSEQVVSDQPKAEQVQQQVQMQVATVAKPDAPKEVIQTEAVVTPEAHEAKPQLLQPQQTAVDNSLQDAANQLINKQAKKEAPLASNTGPQQVTLTAAPVAAESETPEVAGKVAEVKPAAQPLAPITSLTGEAPAESAMPLPNQAANNATQVSPADSQAAQAKAAMFAAQSADPAHRSIAPAQPDFSKSILGVKVDAVQKVSAGESRAQRNAAVRANQQELIDKVQKVIEDAARSKDGNSLSFRLDPPELGAVTVKLTRRNDELHARIIPDNHEVEASIRERIGELQTALQNAGIKVNQIHVSVGQEYSETEMFQFGYAFLGQNAGQKDASSGETGQRDAAGPQHGSVLQDSAVIEKDSSARMAGQVDRGMWVA